METCADDEQAMSYVDKEEGPHGPTCVFKIK